MRKGTVKAPGSGEELDMSCLLEEHPQMGGAVGKRGAAAVGAH